MKMVSETIFGTLYRHTIYANENGLRDQNVSKMVSETILYEIVNDSYD